MKVLLTLGRLAKGLELARSLHRAGHTVIIAEPFKWHLSKPSSAIQKSYRITAPNDDLDQYLADLLAIVDRESIDLVIPVSEEALYTCRLAPLLPDQVHVFGPDFDQMARLHDKLGFARRCHSLGLPAPETYPADTREARALADRADHVIKPIHGCSGIGVHLRGRGDAFKPGEDVPGNLLQERIHGREISSFSVVRNGKVQVTGLYEGDVYLGTVSVRFIRVEDMPAIEGWIAQFVAAETYSGFISFDFIVMEDGTPYAIECNPRLTSGVHLIHPRALAAMVMGEPVAHPHFKTSRAFQDAHSTLTVAVGSIRRPLSYLKLLAKAFTTKDVVFDWRDPLPFFLMTPMSWDTIRPSLTEGISLRDAVTRDILWKGDLPTEPSTPKEVSRHDAQLGH